MQYSNRVLEIIHLTSRAVFSGNTSDIHFMLLQENKNDRKIPKNKKLNTN